MRLLQYSSLGAPHTGMRTMLEDGISKAAQGLTTLEEVLRLAVVEGSAASTEEDPPADRTVPSSASGELTEKQTHDAATISLRKGSAHDQPHGKQRVLVVEDDRTIVMVVKYFLELEGFEVLITKDGKAGLKTAKRERPAVIVTDCSMPGMDGVAMVKALRVDPLTRGIAVLMRTSNESVEQETLALAAGADDYILKPVERRRLAARVKSVLARSNERQVAVSP